MGRVPCFEKASNYLIVASFDCRRLCVYGFAMQFVQPFGKVVLSRHLIAECAFEMLLHDAMNDEICVHDMSTRCFHFVINIGLQGAGIASPFWRQSVPIQPNALCTATTEDISLKGGWNRRNQ